MREGLFDHLLNNLAPGVQDPGSVVRDRVVYQSHEKRSATSSRTSSKTSVKPKRESLAVEPRKPSLQKKSFDIGGVDMAGSLSTDIKQKGKKHAKDKLAEQDLFKAVDFDPEQMQVDPGGRFTDLYRVKKEDLKTKAKDKAVAEVKKKDPFDLLADDEDEDKKKQMAKKDDPFHLLNEDDDEQQPEVEEEEDLDDDEELMQAAEKFSNMDMSL